MLYGQHNLKFGETALNKVSSRSHCIFTIKLLQDVGREVSESARVSMFSFCDLAGAERAKHSQNDGERLSESKNINTSLSVLGRCLMMIRENQKSRGKKLIPFRDSELTRLFQNALNEKECLVMIVNMNPEPHLLGETLNVLNYSAIANEIILPARHKERVPRSSSVSCEAPEYVEKTSPAETPGIGETVDGCFVPIELLEKQGTD
jgi:kinesin family protein 20